MASSRSDSGRKYIMNSLNTASGVQKTTTNKQQQNQFKSVSD